MTIFENQVEQLSVDECMKKWKALRDKFAKELKILNSRNVVILAQCMYCVF